MRIILPLVASAALALAGVACAAQTPRPGDKDARVRTIDYDPVQVVRVTGVYRNATQILFGEQETILHVALGDSSAWQVVAEKNILFIKPMAAHGKTNLIVTTERTDGQHDQQTRNYTFELTTGLKLGANALYVLRFLYPSDVKTESLAMISQIERGLRAKLINLQLERGTIEGVRNLAYEVQGGAALQPSEISDNGRFTIMRFPAGQVIPAIYQVTSDGTESLVPFDVRGALVVIHAVAAQFRLRRGSDVLCLYNTKLDPYGVDLGTHTASATVDRTDVPTPKAKLAPLTQAQP